MTHPLKELEVVLSAGVHHMDSGEDGGTGDALECLREAAEILSGYFVALGFDDSGRAPVELMEAERLINRKERHDIESADSEGSNCVPGGCGTGLLGHGA